MIPSDSSQHSRSGMKLKDYEKLKLLGRVATVDELIGACRLPIGGYFSPCCIRKSTDPTPEQPEKLLVFGYDMEFGSRTGDTSISSGQPRGISFEQAIKHCLFSGTSGSGKTTVVMCLLLQLHCGSLCCWDTD